MSYWATLYRVVPNQVVRPKRDRRTYVADEIDQCRDISGLYLRRPFEKVPPLHTPPPHHPRPCSCWLRACSGTHRSPRVQGYLVDFELQKEIWDRAFGKHYLKVPTVITHWLHDGDGAGSCFAS
jgi:hypothetical protein